MLGGFQIVIDHLYGCFLMCFTEASRIRSAAPFFTSEKEGFSKSQSGMI
jgi:hypothetical protein